jgi:hypothetical protein
MSVLPYVYACAHACIHALSIIRDSTIRDSIIRDSTIRDSIIRDSTIWDSIIRDSTIRDSIIIDVATKHYIRTIYIQTYIHKLLSKRHQIRCFHGYMSAMASSIRYIHTYIHTYTIYSPRGTKSVAPTTTCAIATRISQIHTYIHTYINYLLAKRHQISGPYHHMCDSHQHFIVFVA